MQSLITVTKDLCLQYMNDEIIPNSVNKYNPKDKKAI
jgi:hypothetical protein